LQCSDERTFIAFRFNHLRDHRVRAQHARIYPVDAGEERIDERFDHLASEVSLRERRNRFIDLAGARRKGQLFANALFCLRREELRGCGGFEVGRHE
jgi:hypothetical protein